MRTITANFHQTKKNSKEIIGFSISDKFEGKITDDGTTRWLMANLLRWHIQNSIRGGKIFDLNRRVNIDLNDGRNKQLFFTRTVDETLLTHLYDGKRYTIKNYETGTHLSHVPSSNMEKVLNFVSYSMIERYPSISPLIYAPMETDRSKH
jgi:hypothetical protein